MHDGGSHKIDIKRTKSSRRPRLTRGCSAREDFLDEIMGMTGLWILYKVS
jgi:hypothetical protein